MFLKILSIFALAFQAVMKIADFLKQEQERQTAREAVRQENERIIAEKANEATNIRNDKLDDNFLLAPEQRGARGVQGLPANLLERKGSESDPKNGSGYKDKVTQQDLGAELFKRPKRKVTRVFIHCSDSDRPEHDNVKTIDQWHKKRGWSGIGYHYYIDKSGKLWAGRSLEKIPASQAGHNTGTIAICVGGKSSFTLAQYYKLEDFCHEINNEYLRNNTRLSFHGHNEVSCKTCPNFDYRAVLGLDENGYII